MRNNGWPYWGFQDIFIRVCSRWRNVALCNPILWTYIYIYRPSDLNIAARYIKHSGATTLLDVDLDLPRNFFENDPNLPPWVGNPLSIENTIDFLVRKGATIDRWKSLLVRARVPEVLYKVIEYVRPGSAPSLRFLSLDWKTRPTFSEFNSEIRTIMYLVKYNQPFSNSGDRFPQLRTARFNTIPTYFLLGRPLRQILTGLVDLKLTPAFRLCSHVELHTMLSPNPQLRSLFIDRGFASGNFEPTELQVVLPSLRSFALVWRGSISWTLGIMKMVVGLGIETLYLTSAGPQDGAISKLAKQIANRNAPAETTSPQPLYPALRSLDISGIRHPEGDFIDAFAELLSVLPTVTFLSAPGGALERLGKYPILLPQLERIRVKGEVPPELGFTLSERAQGGFPVKTLEVTERYLGSAIPQWPESLTLILLPFRLTVCYEDHEELSDDLEINFSDNNAEDNEGSDEDEDDDDSGSGDE